MSSALRIAHGTFGRVALLDMDRSLVRHAHPHCHVLLKVDGSDTKFAVGDDLVPLTDQQAVLINAWEPHAYVHQQASPRTVILALYIEPQWLKTFRPNWAASGSPGFFGRRGGNVSPRIRVLAMELAALMMAEPGDNPPLEQLLSALMIAVIERFTPWRTQSGPLQELVRSTHRYDWRIRRAVNLIKLEPHIVRDVRCLAKESGLSRAHFYRLFERSTKMTPHVYVNLLRMELAVQSVMDSEDSLSAVGGNLGFSAQGHFTRFFRDHAGVSPSEFRQVSRLGVSRMGSALRA
jgi:AraC family transcriptional regulator